MRIAYLNPRSAMGGAEVALLNIIAALRQSQPEFGIFLITAENGPLVERVRSLGAACKVIHFSRSIMRLGDAGFGGPAGKQVTRLTLYVRLLLSFPAVVVAMLRLRSALRSLDPDLVHTNGFKMHVLGALAKPKRASLVWHIHDYLSSRPLMARLIKSLRHRCALILANSDSVKADIECVCGTDVKVQTIYNAVDTNVFSPDGDRLDLDSLSGLAVNGSRETVLRIGLLATFARWKGQEVFLRALSLLPPDINWRGYIIGGPIYSTDGSQFSLAELQSSAREMGVSDRVGFTGFVENPAAAIRALDIVVHASTEPEPFGLTIVESMACGRSVILSNAGGAAELIHANGIADASMVAISAPIALSHTPGNAKELAARIVELASDEQLRRRLGSAGQTAVAKRFAVAELARALVPLYESAASRPV